MCFLSFVAATMIFLWRDVGVQSLQRLLGVVVLNAYGAYGICWYGWKKGARPLQKFPNESFPKRSVHNCADIHSKGQPRTSEASSDDSESQVTFGVDEGMRLRPIFARTPACFKIVICHLGYFKCKLAHRNDA